MELNLCIGCMRELKVPGHAPTAASIGRRTLRHLPPETILQGRYILGRVIDETTFNVTYVALDLVEQKRSSIIEYYPERLVKREHQYGNHLYLCPEYSQEYFLEGFDRFKHTALRLKELMPLSGIMPVIDIFYENGTAYIVSGSMDGELLEDCLKHTPSMDMDQVFDRMKPIIVSLKKIHEAGILHSRINPDNLWVNKNGSWLLINFNIKSSVYIPEKMDGYWPIELYQTKEALGPATDVYGICAIIYRVITGQEPQGALDRFEKDLLEASLGVLPAEDRLQAVRINAVMKGLALNAKERYFSMEMLLQDMFPAIPLEMDGRKLYIQNMIMPLPQDCTGRYRFERSLGGIDIITYLGEDLKNGCKVLIYKYWHSEYVYISLKKSLKILNKYKEAFRRGCEEFADIAGRVKMVSDQPGLERCIDIFEADQTVYVVMEKLEGESLAAMISQYGPMAPEVVLRWMRPIISTLQNVHNMGLIHNDITPDHIILNNTGVGKVTNLIYGRLWQPSTTENDGPDQVHKQPTENGPGYVNAIPPHFIAPENLYGTVESGPWTDVYGICAAMYYAMTGNEPNACGEPAAGLKVPANRKIEKALIRGLSPNPKKCFSSMALLEKALYETNWWHRR